MLTIGLGGDLMIGRSVSFFLDDRDPSYIWGNLRPILQQTDFNIVNLETTLTTSHNIVPKVFNFKAAPERVSVLASGPIHAVNLANNHILDYSEDGLLETLHVLDQAKLLHVGAGKNLTQAKKPCIVKKKGIKIGLLGCTDNEPTWQATPTKPGTYFVQVGDLSALQESIQLVRQHVDVLILSIHWGPNMRQRPTPQFRSFAHALIDLGVDVIHGHSAHIFQGVEIYKSKLILYDAGDFVDDYAIDPTLRNDQSFFFILKVDNNEIKSLQMIPTLISNFQVNVSEEKGQIERMIRLCNELNTYPIQEQNSLILPCSTVSTFPPRM